MKTTFDLPDALVLEAKKLAVEERRTLKALVVEGLNLVLARPGAAARPPRKIRWVVARGGVPPETSDRTAMHAWMERHR